MTAMDDSIGEVVELYKEHGLWNNTIVIFTSDNGGVNRGGGYNFPFRGEKGTLWDGGVKSLGFIHSPLLPKSRIGEKSFNLMHVTDWLPTLLDLAGCPNKNFGGLPLDGKSQASAILSNVENEYSIRQEVLHQINPLIYIDDGVEDPRGNWKDDHFGPLKGRCFNIGVRGAIRYRQWKLHTGIGSKKDEDEKSGWAMAPGRIDGFVAFDDDYEDMTDSSINIDELCSDDECEDRQKPLPLPECFGQGFVTESKSFNQKSTRTNGTSSNGRTSYFGTNQLKLYNMELDPFEINDVSDSNIEIVNFLLVKMADYYDEQVTPWNPPEEPESNPSLNDGAWKAWHT